MPDYLTLTPFAFFSSFGTCCLLSFAIGYLWGGDAAWKEAIRIHGKSR